MTQLLFISLILAASMIILFYTMIKNGYGDIYSIIVFVFILFTWIMPMIFYSNRLSVNIVTDNSPSWIIIGVIYFLIQAGIRYVLAWFADIFKSRRKVFSSLLLMYASILFVAIFMRNIGTFYILIIGSSILTATYGLSIKYWMENTGNQKCYQANFLIYSIPLLALIFGKSFSQMFSSFDTLKLWGLIFTSLCSITLIIGIALYFLPDKKVTLKRDNNFDKDRIIKDFETKHFIPYFILLGISSFVYISTITINFNLLNDASTNVKIILPMLIVFISFISLMMVIIVLPWLIKMVNFIHLTLAGISLMTISIIISILMLVFNYHSWQLLVITLIVFSIGFNVIQPSLFGDIVHIDAKTSSNFLLYCLTIESICQALGFMFGSSIFFLNTNSEISLYILLAISLISLAGYIFITVRNKLLLTTLRRKFVQYEFLSTINKKDIK